MQEQEEEEEQQQTYVKDPEQECSRSKIKTLAISLGQAEHFAVISTPNAKRKLS